MAQRGNVIVGQSGGPTAVINRSVAGVVDEAKKHAKIDQIFGMQNGVLGIFDEKFIDLRAATDEEVSRMAELPGAALGSCRFKPKEDDCKRIFEVCKKHSIHYYFYIGGNDSALSASIVNDIARDDDVCGFRYGIGNRSQISLKIGVGMFKDYKLHGRIPIFQWPGNFGG